MERILVAGGTGLAGRTVVTEALRRGHSVRVLSRHGPKPGSAAGQSAAEYVRGDVSSGEGLAAALADIDVVIDTLNAPFLSARKRLTPGARNLTAAMSTASVQRSVVLSIVNVDQCSFSYYQAKTEQECIYTEAPLETVIVRTTQFHDLVASMIRPLPAVPVFLAFPRVSLQPIDITDVAAALVDAATAPGVPDGGRVTLGGPEALPMRSLARMSREAAGGRGVLVPLPLPGGFGRFLRAGRALVPENAAGSVNFQEWLDRSGSRRA